MSLSPDEKRKIYEEEKARLDAQEQIKEEQEQAKKEKAQKQSKKFLVGCLAIVIAIAVIAIVAGVCTPGDGGGSTTSSVVTLSASVRDTGIQFVVTNNDSFDWTNVKLEVNPGILTDGYVLRVPRISSGEVYYAGVGLFAKGSGERFNPLTHKAIDFSIWCDTPRGNGSYYGEW